ncbi:MAG: N-methyl-L-tryptophan oxidase [Candidatus Hydrogenedentes bacterium]|nr:N-methyl-L-tryptophan oxidase [Candidatus Hydrogenedentota bacterium]
MTDSRYDVIVLGLGAMGSAALYHLAKRGARVCGIERHGIAHEFGCSHGSCRMVRKAYFEHPDYIPLLERSYALWETLEEESGQELFVKCGLLLSGLPGSAMVRGLEACYGTHHLPHRRMDSGAAAAEYPQFRFPQGHTVYHDPDGGYVLAEASVEQFISLAQMNGADLLIHEDAMAWQSNGQGVSVTTNQRTVSADKLVLTVGPWAASSFAELGVPLSILRKVQLWYDSPGMGAYRDPSFPCFYFDTENGGFYGFPAVSQLGVKVAEHTGGDPVDDPDHLNRGLDPEDETKVLQFLGEVFPALEPRRTHFSVCMYSMTPDHHFLLGKHPRHENTIIAGGFSGHGFKFAPVIGEVLADLSIDGTTMHPIEFLGLDRFAPTLRSST